jgi:hypothetical protein
VSATLPDDRSGRLPKIKFRLITGKTTPREHASGFVPLSPLLTNLVLDDLDKDRRR